MKASFFLLFVALLLATVAGQNVLLQSTGAEGAAAAVTACPVQGGGCHAPSLDGAPALPGRVLEHTVLAGGCAQMDLHVVRYIPSDSTDGAPAVASWCG